MRKIFFIYLLFFLSIASYLHAQVSGGKKGSGKKEVVVLRPPVYDSTKTLEEQFKKENQYQFIGLQLFLFPVTDPETGPVVFSQKNTDFEKGNKYYTIVDVLEGNIAEKLKQKNAVNRCGYKFKEFDSPQWKDLIIHVVFVLKENNKKDSLDNAPLFWVVCESKQAPYSCSYFNSFISVPYFDKQKQLFQDQNVIDLKDKSKWLCKEVSLVKNINEICRDSIYDVFCLLTNEKGKQEQRKVPSEKYGRSFMTEKDYERLNHANRNQKEQLLKAENEAREKYKTECVKKFGKHNGELIAQNKIETGMTTEMCRVAWGTPWNISKKLSLPPTKETWFYNWRYGLYFENGRLARIEHQD